MYSSWAEKRRKRLTYGIGGFLAALLFLYIAVGLYEPPTCFDAKKNQDELEIDCGGNICSLLCPSQIKPLNTLWVRSFEVSPGLWSAFAYVENPNPASEVLEAHYRFTLYDKNNAVIKEVDDSMFITQDTILPVFTGRIEVGDTEPYRTEFSWTKPLVWTRSKNIYKVEVKEQKITNAEVQPQIRAVVVNKEAFTLEDVEVVAVVYDTKENTIAVSKTYIDSISPRGERVITFSWPYPFNAFPYRWQLIARVPVQEF